MVSFFESLPVKQFQLQENEMVISTLLQNSGGGNSAPKVPGVVFYKLYISKLLTL
jgi:hypothetical protein